MGMQSIIFPNKQPMVLTFNCRSLPFALRCPACRQQREAASLQHVCFS